MKREETERYETELARAREELERQYADDMQHARSAAVESLEALTGSILKSV